jgi:hypothetical protein
VGVTCSASPFSLERPAGDHYLLGFAMSCAHQAGQTYCGDSTVGPSAGDVVIADDGMFHDHAIAWPIGAVDAVRPWRARGICIGGAHVRCYSGLGSGVGTLADTVDW